MSEPVTETSVVDDVLEEWEDLEAGASETEYPTFADAVVSHYVTIKDLLSDPGTSDELREMLASEVAIIDRWFEIFRNLSNEPVEITVL